MDCSQPLNVYWTFESTSGCLSVTTRGHRVPYVHEVAGMLPVTSQKQSRFLPYGPCTYRTTAPPSPFPFSQCQLFFPQTICREEPHGPRMGNGLPCPPSPAAGGPTCAPRSGPLWLARGSLNPSFQKSVWP